MPTFAIRRPVRPGLRGSCEPLTNTAAGTKRRWVFVKLIARWQPERDLVGNMISTTVAGNMQMKGGVPRIHRSSSLEYG
jgi:hypothetical protein